jgi:hypothetical protein
MQSALKAAGFMSVTAVAAVTEVDMGGDSDAWPTWRIVAVAVGGGGGLLLLLLVAAIAIVLSRRRKARMAVMPQDPATSFNGTQDDPAVTKLQAGGKDHSGAVAAVTANGRSAPVTKPGAAPVAEGVAHRDEGDSSDQKFAVYDNPLTDDLQAGLSAQGVSAAADSPPHAREQGTTAHASTSSDRVRKEPRLSVMGSSGL